MMMYHKKYYYYFNRKRKIRSKFQRSYGSSFSEDDAELIEKRLESR